MIKIILTCGLSAMNITKEMSCQSYPSMSGACSMFRSFVDVLGDFISGSVPPMLLHDLSASYQLMLVLFKAKLHE